jgi:hypothetical protein
MSSDRRPVWLLDVDGVINATRPGWGAAPHHGTARAGDLSFRIRWAPALARRIRTLHKSGLVEIRWCSTWCVYADEIERLLGLPELGRAFDEEINGVAARLAKFTAALAVVAEGRPLIWADDDAIPQGDDRLRLGDALLIEPQRRRGLQPEDMDAIEAFVARHSNET